MRAPLRSAALLAAIALGTACGDEGADPPPRLGTNLTVTSSGFANGQTIPARYTCDGENVSPPLEWSEGPENTTSYAIVMSDPDAPDGTFIHWVVWGIDAEILLVQEATDLGTKGETGFGAAGYGGPCPPEGDDPHRYRFSVYALSRVPDLPEGSGWPDLLEVIDRFALAEGTIEGSYRRA